MSTLHIGMVIKSRTWPQLKQGVFHPSRWIGRRCPARGPAVAASWGATRPELIGASLGELGSYRLEKGGNMKKRVNRSTKPIQPIYSIKQKIAVISSLLLDPKKRNTDVPSRRSERRWPRPSVGAGMKRRGLGWLGTTENGGEGRPIGVNGTENGTARRRWEKQEECD